MSYKNENRVKFALRKENLTAYQIPELMLILTSHEFFNAVILTYFFLTTKNLVVVVRLKP